MSTSPSALCGVVNVLRGVNDCSFLSAPSGWGLDKMLNPAISAGVAAFVGPLATLVAGPRKLTYVNHHGFFSVTNEANVFRYGVSRACDV